jgi:ribonuclease-3
VKGLAPATREWLEAKGFVIADEAPWSEALTHGGYNVAGAEVAD